MVLLLFEVIEKQKKSVLRMLNELKTYQQSLNIPLQKQNVKAKKYYFELVKDTNTEILEEIYLFRAIQFSRQFGISFANGRDHDAYDLTCQHAILRDEWSNEIVAYTRVKFLYGDELHKSYSQQEFYLEHIFQDSDRIVEIGRTCVHLDYRSSRAVSILWAHIFNYYILNVRANYLIGCVSIKKFGNEENIYDTHQFIQQLPVNQSCNIQSKNIVEIACSLQNVSKKIKMPKLFDVYLKMNGKLSKQAYFDRDFNCLDYFVLMPVGEMRQNF